jgi:hypothetical protein
MGRIGGGTLSQEEVGRSRRQGIRMAAIRIVIGVIVGGGRRREENSKGCDRSSSLG